MQKKDSNPTTRAAGDNIRISNYGAGYYNLPHGAFGPGTLPALQPNLPPNGPVPVPLPLPPSPSPPPIPISPIPPPKLTPIRVQPLPPPLMTDTLEDDNSIVVGLKVYTTKNAPTTIIGKVQNSDQAKEPGNVRY